MKVRTVYDAGQERRDECAMEMGRAIERQNKLNRERQTLRLYPEIGILQRGLKTIFYAFVSGIYYESADLDTVSRKVSPVPRIVRRAS